MPTLTLHQIDTRITEAERTYDEEINPLANEIYNTIVVPFCRKYNLTYKVLMGDGAEWSFQDRQGKMVARYDDLREGVIYTRYSDELRKICEILELNCLGITLGTKMSDYTGK